jgi:hypothetical protein
MQTINCFIGRTNAIVPRPGDQARGKGVVLQPRRLEEPRIQEGARTVLLYIKGFESPWGSHP